MREQIAQQPPLKRRASAAQGQSIQRRRSGTASYPASPQGAGHYAGLHPEDMPYQSSQLTRAQQPQEDDEEPDGSYYDTRTPPSSRRYTDVQEIVQGNRRLVIHPYPSSSPGIRKRHFHPLLIGGIVATVIIAGVILLSRAEIWWANEQNQAAYGYPRTYQTDAVVGHSDSAVKPSHFIAINNHGQIEVIEFPGGDGTHAKIYLGPQLFGDGDDLVPVTVSFKDVNGDGKPDMLIHLQDQTIIFLNSKGEFASANK